MFREGRYRWNKEVFATIRNDEQCDRKRLALIIRIETCCDTTPTLSNDWIDTWGDVLEGRGAVTHLLRGKASEGKDAGSHFLVLEKRIC